MSAGQLAAQVLLWAGVAVELVCCIGVWWMRGAFDRLHYASAGSSVGPVLVGVAVALAGAGSTAGTVEACTAAAVLVVVGPMVTHATGRAARRLRFGDLGSGQDGGLG